jgi:hypothetical protein
MLCCQALPNAAAVVDKLQHVAYRDWHAWWGANFVCSFLLNVCRLKHTLLHVVGMHLVYSSAVLMLIMLQSAVSAQLLSWDAAAAMPLLGQAAGGL